MSRVEGPALTSNFYHLRKLVFLQELLFELNPICNSTDYINHILTVFPWLEILDRGDISDEMRAEAEICHRKRIAEEADSRQELIKARAPSSREEVILEARRRWQSVRNFVKSASTTNEPPEIKQKPKPKENKVALSSYIDIMREFKSYASKAPEKNPTAPTEDKILPQLPKVASDHEIFKMNPLFILNLC
ncbi:unnamed protein product [Allacma fusca]|uniref:Uncharacterized protein n=1 Tax=Allacma fusca TaxID=39272 RepID=A0A8J2P329_9HEXA|nr:unnamed protein product [Allacma fusca]